MNDTTAPQEEQRQPGRQLAPASFARGGAIAALIPTTVDDVFRLGDAIAKSGLAPKTLNDSMKCTVAIMAGMELGMPPYQAVQSFAVIGNRATLWGDGFLGVLLSHGFDVEERFEGDEDADPLDDAFKAICTVTRPAHLPNPGKVVTRTFTVADAKKAKLWGKEGPWQTATKRMLQMRARAFAGRDNASDVLRGLKMAEEVEDYGPEVEDTPRGPKPKMDLRSQLKAGGETEEGFNGDRIRADTGQGRRQAAEETPHDPVTGEVIDAEFEDTGAGGDVVDAPAGEPVAETLAEAAAAVANDPPPEFNLEAEDNAVAEGNTTDGPAAGTNANPEVDATPEAEAIARHSGGGGTGYLEGGGWRPGTGYVLKGDAKDKEGGRPLYIDGKKVGTAGANMGAPELDAHPLSADAGIDAADQAEVDAESQEPEPDAALATLDELQAAETAADATVALPTDPVERFWAEVASLDSWKERKGALGRLAKTPKWPEMGAELQDVLRGSLWDSVERELLSTGKDKVDPADDPTAFRCWVETQVPNGKDGADAIEGTFRLLMKAPLYVAMKPESQASLAKTAEEKADAARKG